MRLLFLVFALLACVAGAQPAAEKHLQEAIALHQSGNFEGAIREYREYLKARPDSMSARSNLGAALAHMGRYDEAVEEYKRALRLEPRNAAVLLNLGLTYYKTDRMPEAAEQLELVMSLGPPSQQAILLLADCDVRLGEYKKAIALLSPLEKENARDAGFNYLLGTALVRDGQPDRGGVLIDRILRNGDSAEARLLLGTTKLFSMDYAGALPELKKAVDLNPRLPEVHSYYGQALLRTGDPAGAGTEFRAELEANPTDFMSNLEMGVLAKEDQNYAEASRYFDRALKSRPGDPGVRYQVATIDLALENVEDARNELEKLVKESPQFTEAHVSLATVYYRLKRKPEGDRERAIVQKLLAEQQAKQPGVNPK
ncbi:MAG: tetratricopeptide repeat protein [Acidobacteriia bacterium]|nr:tetratricopeptide repeat protein [Terriglobia bacterium]